MDAPPAGQVDVNIDNADKNGNDNRNNATSAPSIPSSAPGERRRPQAALTLQPQPPGTFRTISSAFADGGFGAANFAAAWCARDGHVQDDGDVSMSKWWEPLLQTTVDAYYAGDLKSGLQACEQLLSGDDLPRQIELQVRRNLVFYTPKLQELTPSMTRQRISIPAPTGWSTFNPSIAVDPSEPESGFALTIRSANYTVTRLLEYDVSDADDIFRTRNYLATLSPDFQLQTVQHIDDAAFRPAPPPFPVSGYEDARIVRHCGSWWFSATVRDHNPQGMCQIALLRLEDGQAVEEHLLSDGISRHEKNWMPVATDDPHLRFVYSLAPTVVLRYDDAQGIVVPDVIWPGPAVARTFSGGSQVIRRRQRLSLSHPRSGQFRRWQPHLPSSLGLV